MGFSSGAGASMASADNTDEIPDVARANSPKKCFNGAPACHCDVKAQLASGRGRQIYANLESNEAST